MAVTQKERLRKAAGVMSDLFASTVMRGLDETPPRQFLYGWEQRAIDLLKVQFEKDPETTINGWTCMYVRHGPPPWNGKD